MYLLYLDESGTDGGNVFVLAGLAVFEHDAFFLVRDFEKLQSDTFPDVSVPIEFHATKIRARKEEPWDGLSSQQARDLLDGCYAAIARSRCTLFGVAIERSALRPEDGDEYSFAFESLLKRFDGFLARKYRESGERHKGLVIIADSAFRQRIELLANELLRSGSRWGELFNQVEIPLFTLARNSRLLQAADLCANAVRGRYESGFTTQFDRIVGKFDADPADPQIHGLFHYTRDYASCYCPACLSRR